MANLIVKAINSLRSITHQIRSKVIVTSSTILLFRQKLFATLSKYKYIAYLDALFEQLRERLHIEYGLNKSNPILDHLWLELINIKHAPDKVLMISNEAFHSWDDQIKIAMKKVGKI